jgi:thioredoxin-related protein
MAKYFLFTVLFVPVLLIGQPVELGTINWLRSYDEAMDRAKSTNRDIFILFQEVPGCSTCQKYGEQVMSDPFMKEIIETYYVPLAIYNNKEGSDKKILEKYNEPSWNNPVVRIVDQDGKSIRGRLSGKYSKSAVLDYILKDLKGKTTLPAYISLLEAEWYALKKGTDELVLSMYCFWTGEKVLGAIPGVINTTSGFMERREVVKVEYDPDVVSQDYIIAFGKENDFVDFSSENDSKFRLDTDQNYYLKHSKYRQIPMTEMQAMKVNSVLGQGKVPDYLLSPRQLKMLE